MKEINLNLDSYINADKLQSVAIELNNHPRLYAKQLFSNVPGAVKAIKLLVAYAWNKSTAMNLRLINCTLTATMYEDICEKIYNQLPEYAQW